MLVARFIDFPRAFRPRLPLYYIRIPSQVVAVGIAESRAIFGEPDPPRARGNEMIDRLRRKAISLSLFDLATLQAHFITIYDFAL